MSSFQVYIVVIRGAIVRKQCVILNYQIKPFLMATPLKYSTTVLGLLP